MAGKQLYQLLVDNPLTATLGSITPLQPNDTGATEMGATTYQDLCIALGIPITVKVSLSSAEILQLNTTPKTLVAAPGTGLAIVPMFFFYKYNFGTLAYTTNQTLALNYEGVASANIQNTILSNVENATGRQAASSTALATYVTFDYPVENKAFEARVNNGNPLAGDGTLDIYFTYTIISL